MTITAKFERRAQWIALGLMLIGLSVLWVTGSPQANAHASSAPVATHSPSQWYVAVPTATEGKFLEVAFDSESDCEGFKREVVVSPHNPVCKRDVESPIKIAQNR